MSVAVAVPVLTAAELERMVYGCEAPRVFTPPLRDVDNDEAATLGFEVIDFAEVELGLTLFAWQKWWLRHALELKLDGTLRFRTVLTLIARQNGKTFLLKIVSLYFLYIRRVRLVLGIAQDLTTARESLVGSLEWAEDQPDFAAELIPNPRGRDGYEAGSGREVMKLTGRRRYMIKAATRKAGRGLSVKLLILDELREWRDTYAWASLSKTVIAQGDAFTLAITNAGDDGSIILASLYGAALDPERDAIAIFEWSAPPEVSCTCMVKPHALDCGLRNVDAMAQANPSMNHPNGIMLDALLDALATDPPEVFQTECLCQHVDSMSTLINPVTWGDQAVESVKFDPAADKLAAVVDIAPDGEHATLVVAAQSDPDGPIRVRVVKSWDAGSIDRLDVELPEAVKRLKVRRFGWFPVGPAAEKATVLRAIPRNVELRDVSEACQELVGLIRGGRFEHDADPLLTAHVLGAKRYDVGDGFRFVRKGTGHVDAAYALAGAAKLARQLARRWGPMVV